MSYFPNKSILKIHLEVCHLQELLIIFFSQGKQNHFEMQRITLLKFTYLVSLGISFHILYQLLKEGNNSFKKLLCTLPVAGTVLEAGVEQ